MDGIARLWSREGVLQHSLNAHSESIFSLRFDSAGKRLLTGSYDKCVSVWDVRTGSIPNDAAIVSYLFTLIYTKNTLQINKTEQATTGSSAATTKFTC